MTLFQSSSGPQDPKPKETQSEEPRQVTLCQKEPGLNTQVSDDAVSFLSCERFYQHYYLSALMLTLPHHRFMEQESDVGAKIDTKLVSGNPLQRL